MKRTLAVALLAVGLVGLAVTPLFALSPTLVVTDGSITGVIEGNFVNYTYTNASIIRYFNATTYASQSGGPASALTLRLYTFTVYSGGKVMVNIDATVQGAFASDLRLSGLTLTLNETGQQIISTNETGPNIIGRASGVETNATGDSTVNPVNVSWGSGPSNPVVTLGGTDAGTLTPTLVNQTGKGPFYAFVYPVYFYVFENPGYNHFVGLRATVTGVFTPAVSVGILLQIIDVPGGVWG